MSNPIELGRLFGIKIRASWSFVVVLGLVLIAARNGGMLQSTWLTFAILLGAVLLHELGHALCARAFGIQVLDITFWPLGGMARMSAVPESPRIESWIALAGPLTNLAAALLVLPLLLLGAGHVVVPTGASFGLRFLAENFWIHMSLGVFNLIPAFPMDGGRVLRAWLAKRKTWLVATEEAVRVSRFATLGLLVGGMLLLPKLTLVLAVVALFLLFEGFSELTQVRLRHAPELFGLGARSAPPGELAREAVFTESPVHEHLTHADQPQVSTFAKEVPSGDGRDPETALHPGARRPTLWSAEASLLRGRRHGFDAEVIKNLEAYPGSIRPPGPETP